MIDHPDHADVPYLDEDGLLRLGRRWVAVPDAQLPIVALLLDRYGRVVPLALVASTYAEAGYSAAEASIRSLLSRVNRTVRTLGLSLRTVRCRGVMLVPATMATTTT